jgi:hypothetical protein
MGLGNENSAESSLSPLYPTLNVKPRRLETVKLSQLLLSRYRIQVRDE